MTVKTGADPDPERAPPAVPPEPRPDFRSRLKDHEVLQWALANLGAGG